MFISKLWVLQELLSQSFSHIDVSELADKYSDTTHTISHSQLSQRLHTL